jgi:hypothetical protein
VLDLIVTRLGRQRKLTCTDCRTCLLRKTQRILVQDRQYEGAIDLSSSSASLAAYLKHAKSRFRSSTAENLHLPFIGKRLTASITRGAPSLQCCHPTTAAIAIVKLFLRVRLHYFCKEKNCDNRLKRKLKRKNKKLKNLVFNIYFLSYNE